MKYSKLILDPDFKVGKTDERIFGSFVEHLGRCVYGGIYEPGHPEADEDGFRKDVMNLIKELNVPIVRYPGGNFVSGYNWEDGIGPVELRPKRMELAWGTLETNEFGTDEFMKWCKKTGTQPMMAVNLGTRGADEARQLVEYCNHPGGTFLSDLRKKNGSADPYGVKLWCLGNEMDGPWQMGSKTATEYGRIACESAKIMKWTDPSIETVLCGSSGWHMKTFGEWETTALDLAYDHVDYVSMHQYHSNSDNYLENFLAKGVETDAFIDSIISALDYVQGKRHSKKQINISFDEWNVWYHSHGAEFEKWSKAPHILEDIYDYSDALVVATMINSILRHCDRVKIACLAQLVNVIAPIMTEDGGKAWKQTIFYPFYYASKYARGYVLHGITQGTKYDTRWYTDVPHVDSCAVLSEDETELVIFAVNRDCEDNVSFETQLNAFGDLVPVEYLAMEDIAPDTINTKDSETVRPVKKPLPTIDGKSLKASLRPMSWNMFRLAKKTDK